MTDEDLARQSRRWRVLGHLARGLAHDMNNALQTIVGALNTVDKLIQTGNLERTPRFIAAGLRSAQRGGELNRTLQRLARAELSGARAVELNAFIRSLEELFRRLCGDQIALRMELTDPAPVVECDPGELEEVLLTLVLDAAEAIAGAGEISITTQPLDGELASVWIRDTGAVSPTRTVVARFGSSVESTPGGGTTVRLLLPAHTG